MNSNVQKMNKIKQMEYAANLLYEKELYDSCINRYYYCIFQRILKYLDENNIKVEKLKAGSHNETAKIFVKSVFKNNYIEGQSFTANFHSLKENRHLADYELHKLNKNNATVTKVQFNDLMDELDKIMGGD